MWQTKRERETERNQREAGRDAERQIETER